MTPPAAVMILAAAVSLTDLASPFLQPGSREARLALERYRDGEWVEAIETLEEALEAGDDPLLAYNLGAAAYKGQNYPEALKAYARAARSEAVPFGRVAYDRGNVQVQTGDLEGALESYRAALRADPGDEDARYNYELVLRRMQGQEQEPEQNQDEQGGDQGENRQEPSGEAPRDSTVASQGSPERSEGDQGEEPPRPQPGDEEQEDQGPVPEAGRNAEQAGEGEGGSEARPQGQLLSPEQAVRLLNAVTPEERELLEARLKSTRRRRVEKDW